MSNEPQDNQKPKTEVCELVKDNRKPKTEVSELVKDNRKPKTEVSELVKDSRKPKTAVIEPAQDNPKLKTAFGLLTSIWKFLLPWGSFDIATSSCGRTSAGSVLKKSYMSDDL